MPELLIGCGNKRDRIIQPLQRTEWTRLVTLDNDPNCGADVEWDLMNMPLPFKDGEFDEIHAYHVLEHTGAQGDFRFFFAQFSEFYRLLKPGGFFCGIVPSFNSGWLFGDPGHTRVIVPEMFTFLDQKEYTNQVGVTALADYRRFWRGDFERFAEHYDDDNKQVMFALRVVKPSRISI